MKPDNAEKGNDYVRIPTGKMNNPFEGSKNPLGPKWKSFLRKKRREDKLKKTIKPKLPTPLIQKRIDHDAIFDGYTSPRNVDIEQKKREGGKKYMLLPSKSQNLIVQEEPKSKRSFIDTLRSPKKKKTNNDYFNETKKKSGRKRVATRLKEEEYVHNNSYAMLPGFELPTSILDTLDPSLKKLANMDPSQFQKVAQKTLNTSPLSQKVTELEQLHIQKKIRPEFKNVASEISLLSTTTTDLSSPFYSEIGEDEFDEENNEKNQHVTIEDVEELLKDLEYITEKERSKNHISKEQFEKQKKKHTPHMFRTYLGEGEVIDYHTLLNTQFFMNQITKMRKAVSYSDTVKPIDYTLFVRKGHQLVMDDMDPEKLEDMIAEYNQVEDDKLQSI